MSKVNPAPFRFEVVDKGDSYLFIKDTQQEKKQNNIYPVFVILAGALVVAILDASYLVIFLFGFLWFLAYRLIEYFWTKSGNNFRKSKDLYVSEDEIAFLKIDKNGKHIKEMIFDAEYIRGMRCENQQVRYWDHTISGTRYSYEGAKMVFDYGGDTVREELGLTESETRAIVNTIIVRFPNYAKEL